MNGTCVAVSHEASSRRSSIWILVVGTCGELCVGLARCCVVYVWRCDGLHRSWDDNARLDNRLRVDKMVGQPVGLKTDWIRSDFQRAKASNSGGQRDYIYRFAV